MGAFRQLGKNTLIITVGNTSSKIITLLLLPLYTSWLSVSDYGLTDLITVYSTLLLGIISGCIAEAIFVLPKNKNEDEIKSLFTSGFIYICIACCVAGGVFYILQNLFVYLKTTNSFVENLGYIFIVLVSNIFYVYFQQFSRSINKIGIYSFSSLIVAISTAIFSFLFIPYYGVYGFVLSTVFAYIVSSLYLFIFGKEYAYIRIKSFNLKKLGELLNYSLPLIPNAIMWWLVSASNRPLIEKYCGLTAIGLLGVANKFPGIVNILLTSFNSSWLISILDEYGKPNFNLFFNKGLAFFTFLLISTSCALTIVSQLVIEIFTSDPTYYQGWVYIPILTLSTVFSCLAGLIGAVFSAERTSRYYFYSSLWGAIPALLLNILLIPIFGVWGAVWAGTLSMITMMLARIFYIRKYVHFTCYYSILLQVAFFFVVFLTTLYTKGFVFYIAISCLFIIYSWFNRKFIFDLFKSIKSKK